MASTEERYEIAFFDVETTVPRKPGQRFAILEFGAILVCPRKLVELRSYSTLIKPSDVSLISSLSVRCNGISPDAVSSSPAFVDVADVVFDILHGRIWAGHNILRFDCARIREAYADIGRPPPEPKGTIDSLALLTQKFGRRAGDMKMATLATYFGLGQQSHRSLDDVRMNLEVLKYCATVLLLESSLPDIFSTNSWVSPNAITRSRGNGKSSLEGRRQNVQFPVGPESSSASQIIVENHPISSLMAQSRANLTESNASYPDPFDMAELSTEITVGSHQADLNMEDKSIPEVTDVSSMPTVHQIDGSSVEFLDPDQVFIPCVSASRVPLYNGAWRIKLLHNDKNLQLKCTRLKVRFGISTKFVDHAGRPRLSFVVDASPSLCRVLDSCDDVARKLSLEFGSNSEWRQVVSRKNGFVNYPTVRLHIPTAVCGEIAIYATEIYQKDNSGSVQRLVFSKFDALELNTLFTQGTNVDAFFSLAPYDFQQNAGIRLVTKKLIIHSD